MKTVTLRPVKGRTVYDIEEHKPLEKGGRVFTTPLGKYWLRRLALGSVEMVKTRKS